MNSLDEKYIYTIRCYITCQDYKVIGFVEDTRPHIIKNCKINKKSNYIIMSKYKVGYEK